MVILSSNILLSFVITLQTTLPLCICMYVCIHSITDGTYDRCFSAVVPKADHPLPVLMWFHGAGGNAHDCGNTGHDKDFDLSLEQYVYICPCIYCSYLNESEHRCINVCECEGMLRSMGSLWSVERPLRTYMDMGGSGLSLRSKLTPLVITLITLIIPVTLIILIVYMYVCMNG